MKDENGLQAVSATQSITCPEDSKGSGKLTLTSVSFERVEFEARIGMPPRLRRVSVLAGSDRSWARALRFPHIQSEHGESLGSDALDEVVRERAADELVRLAAAVAVLEAARWTA